MGLFLNIIQDQIQTGNEKKSASFKSKSLGDFLTDDSVWETSSDNFGERFEEFMSFANTADPSMQEDILRSCMQSLTDELSASMEIIPAF